MFAKLNRLKFSLLMISVQLWLIGLTVWTKEVAYHVLLKHAQRSGVLLYAFDPEDDDFKAAVQAAVDEAVGALKTKNKELLGKVKKLQSNSEIDPADVERLETEVETLRTQLADANKAVKDVTKRAETAEKTLTSEQQNTQRLLVDNGLAAALTEAGVTNPTMHRAAAALIRSGQQIEITADGEARVAKIGDKALGDFVKSWAQGDEGKAFVAAPGNGGGGATGSGAGGAAKVNPWAKESFNLTAQSKAYLENPTLAKQQAAEHGVTLT